MRIVPLFLLTVLMGSVLVPQSVAASVQIRPLIADLELAPRETVTESITVTNPLERRQVVYATVNGISVADNGDIEAFVAPVMTDRTRTLPSWIEVTRARIELGPLETREIPVTVRVHPYAEPGEYHAFVGFVPAAKRPEAEAIARAGQADGVMFRVEIPDQRIESVRVSRFIIDRFVTGLDEQQAVIDIENMGDIEVVPEGELVFYDTRGAELSSVPINPTRQSVAAGNTLQLTVPVTVSTGLGRYKANVFVTYGSQRAMLTDTTFFYLFPWPIMLGIFFAILLTTGAISWWVVARRDEDDSADGDEVAMYVGGSSERSDHNSEHDINLKQQ